MKAVTATDESKSDSKDAKIIDMPLFLINNTDGFIKIYLNIEVIEMK